MSKPTRKRKEYKPNTLAKRNNRIIFAILVFGLAFSVIVGRLAYLQLYKYEYYKTRATQIQVRETELTPKRGTIYDSNMKVLAQSATVWTVFVSPAESKEDQNETVALNLGEILDVDPNSIREKLKKTDSYYQVVKYQVEKPDADRVLAFVEENGIKGVNVIEDYKRYYPYGNFASTILGFCGTDGQGLAGLESYYDEELTGTVGRVISSKNGWGYEMGTDYEVLSEAKNGYSLRTTIDTTIQRYLEKHLKMAAEENLVQEGAVGIVMNVKTGAILGMAVYPAFDPNDPYTLVDTDLYNSIMAISDEAERNEKLSAARQKQWRNKAVNDLYEPGSVFKTITASAALDSGTCTLNSSFVCRGAITIEDTTIKCSQTGGHGAETFSQAVINSCNPAFITIGQRMGKDLFYDYFYAFGLAEKTGIDLPGEQNSIYYTNETHTAVTLASSSFGQSNKITPIQMITAIATAVNGGNLVTPHLVDRLLDEDGNVVENIAPPIRRQVISEQTSRTIANILRQNVDNGNGGVAYVAGYRVGGKSGTSEKLDTPQKDDYIASFVGIAPADDPEIAILIFLDDPRGPNGYYGGPLSGSVVGALMGEILPYLGIEPSYSRGEQSKKITVSSIIDYSITDAAVKLQRSGLTIRIIGNGTKVVGQYPAYGQKLGLGSMVIAYTDSGQATVAVPDLHGKTPSQVQTALSGNNLNLAYDGSYPSQYVCVSQSPVAGEEVPLGTVVTVKYRPDEG